MTSTNAPAVEVPAEQRAFAAAMKGYAERMIEQAERVKAYAANIAADPTFMATLGSEYAASGYVAQIMGEVEGCAPRPGAVFEVARTLTIAVSKAQRGAVQA